MLSAGLRRPLFGVAVFSALINVLYLTGSLYMLQVYDRVIPSRSLETLIALSLLAVMLMAAQGALDIYRARILGDVGRSLDEKLAPQLFSITRRLPLVAKSQVGLQPIHDLDNVRGFFTSGGPAAIFDLPWAPLYIAVCFLIHPLIGLTALAGVLVLTLLTGLTELLSRDPIRQATSHGLLRTNAVAAARRNAEVITAMGMGAPLSRAWTRLSEKYLDANRQASGVAVTIGGISKSLRMMLQSAALGVGAYLVIRGQATGGIIIAGSILAGRALAPIEQMLAHYKGFVAARQSWRRLQDLLASFPEPLLELKLPRPSRSLAVENLAVAPPGSQRLTLQGVNFTAMAGDGVGIIGRSASGKSTLARTLVGVWRPARGSVRLDGAALDQWASDELGPHIGYLPQDTELFDGTIAENIRRFYSHATDEAVILAAQRAGVHEMVTSLPSGYNTRIGADGAVLSGGQRQRIGLARALYGDPFLLVLDEPNSNLDAEGDQALSKAVTDFRARGGIAILVAHRPSALESVDQVLIIANGEVKAFGPKDKMLRPAPPLRAVETPNENTG